jgi:hypothetical protein
MTTTGRIAVMLGVCVDTVEQRLAAIADAGPIAIDERLAELDRQWTAGRLASAIAGIAVVAGLALSFVNPWWLVLPAVAGLLLCQTFFARSWLLEDVLRSLGCRSRFEVDEEKMALKILRGDFTHLHTVQDVEKQDDISRLEGEGGIVIDPEETVKVEPIEAAKKAVEATKS